jgi:hypothetical protein
LFLLALPLLLLLPGLEPGAMLANLFQQVPELCQFANLDLQVNAAVVFVTRWGFQTLGCVQHNLRPLTQEFCAYL